MLCYRLGYSKVAVESEKKIIFDSICGGAVPRSFKTFLLPPNPAVKAGDSVPAVKAIVAAPVDQSYSKNVIGA
jgi:hypothetical protein